MEGEIRRSGEAGHPPQLLYLIPEEKKEWIVKDAGGGFQGEEEKKLELRLGPPGGEEYWSPVLEEKREEASVLSYGFLTHSMNHCAGAKRGFLDTVESETHGLQQLQNQSLEMKACCQQAHGAPRNGDGASISAHTRTTSVPVVGWPPIRSFRRNLASNSSKPLLESQNKGSETVEKNENRRKGSFIKINMDGIPIGRKVDLKAYDNYEKLSSVVVQLFRDLLEAQRDAPRAEIQKAEERRVFTGLLYWSGEYTLVYEDNEGDRMLVGDVPWDMFVSTATRLRVLKSSELPFLSLGAVSRKKTMTTF